MLCVDADFCYCPHIWLSCAKIDRDAMMCHVKCKLTWDQGTILYLIWYQIPLWKEVILRG